MQRAFFMRSDVLDLNLPRSQTAVLVGAGAAPKTTDYRCAIVRQPRGKETVDYRRSHVSNHLGRLWKAGTKTHHFRLCLHRSFCLLCQLSIMVRESDRGG